MSDTAGPHGPDNRFLARARRALARLRQEADPQAQSAPSQRPSGGGGFVARARASLQRLRQAESTPEPPPREPKAPPRPPKGPRRRVDPRLIPDVPQEPEPQAPDGDDEDLYRVIGGTPLSGAPVHPQANGRSVLFGNPAHRQGPPDRTAPMVGLGALIQWIENWNGPQWHDYCAVQVIDWRADPRDWRWMYWTHSRNSAPSLQAARA